MHLSLRPPAYRDIFCMVSAFKHPHFTDGLRYEGPVSLWEALQDVRRMRRLRHAYSIREGLRTHGRVWIVHREGEWQLGYWLHPRAQGKGVMTNAVRELLRRTELQEIVAYCHPWNERSRKVLLNNDFVPCGVLDGKERFVLYRR